MVAGKTVEQAPAPYRARVSDESLVRNQLARYLAFWEVQVAQGRRSEDTLREIRRYAKPCGPFERRAERPIDSITYADVEDWLRSS